MKTILLIEDEKALNNVYKEILEEAGFKVIVAFDGEQGLEMAKNEKWDLMLLDIMLPKLDGLVVLEKVREIDKFALRKIIVLSNLGRESIIKQCFELGADAHIEKVEVEPDQLVEKVKRFLT